MGDDAAIPCSRTALADHLNELGIREDTYHLYGAPLNDAIVMDRRPKGLGGVLLRTWRRISAQTALHRG